MSDPNATRQYSIQVFFLLGALLLIGKALQIQVIDSTYRIKGTTAGIDKITLYPSRGLIYDRNHELLVNNNPLYDLLVTYRRIDPDMDTTKFCSLLGISRQQFVEGLEKDWRNPRYSQLVPFVFKSKIPADTFARFQESLYEFPGFFAQVRNVRSYPYPNGAHLLGYIREVNQQEVDDPGASYVPGDYIGAAGLEETYEPWLRGRKGARFIMKDKFGREVGGYKEGQLDTLPISGSDLVTTIEIDLQAYGEYLMQNKTGSIVAIEPSSGEILSMISMPAYDPNQLSINNNRGKAFQQLLDDPNLPFFDRAVMAKYPPGSIFKPVVALIGLQEGVISPGTGFSCSMGYYYNGRLYGCHDHPYPATVQMAIQHSCNAYFWQTFRRIIDKESFYKPEVGLDRFNDYVYQFGLGRELGLDFPREKSGNVPTSEYYDEIYGGKGGWKSPTIMSVGIGQGELQMTTLQMANMAAAIANRGYFIKPHLVKGFDQDSLPPELQPGPPNQIAIDAAWFDLVADGMERVVTSGTARSAYIYDVPFCGKTGTAQNPHGEDHSVFFGFAPKENPVIAIAVYVENAGWGGSYAAPIASLMAEKYIKGQIDPRRQYLENYMIGVDLVSEP